MTAAAQHQQAAYEAGQQSVAQDQLAADMARMQQQLEATDQGPMLRHSRIPHPADDRRTDRR